MYSELRYLVVDLSEWSRADLFKHYIEHMRVVMSLTVDIDVSSLIWYGKRNGLKFYLVMLWSCPKWSMTTMSSSTAGMKTEI